MCIAFPLVLGIDEGFDEPIEDMPDNFKQWFAENSEQIEAAEKKEKLPYFMMNNKKYFRKIK
jgi:dsDNA-binding SOS-regulon protein